MSRLVLVPELVPSPLWGRSAARLLPRAGWRRVRARQIEAVGHACQVCGHAPDKGLICHERWLLEPPRAILAQLRLQCRRCDLATHIGLADSRGRGDVARWQLARVNQITMEEVELLVEGAYERHATLSRHREWTVEVHAPLVDVHPELADLPALDADAGSPSGWQPG